MPQVRLVCSCGWSLYYMTEVGGPVHCPSCGERFARDVVRAAPEAPYASPWAPAPLRVKPWWHLWTMLVAGCLLAASLVWFVIYFAPETEEQARARGRTEALLQSPVQRTPLPIPDAEPVAAPAPPPPPPPPVSPPTAVAPVDRTAVLAGIRRLNERSNLIGLVESVLRFASRPKDLDEVHTLLIENHRELVREVQKLSGSWELRQVPPRFEPGDELVYFEGVNLDPRNPGPFTGRIQAWLSTFQAGASSLTGIRRGDQDLAMPFYFPERKPELLTLAARAGTLPATAAPVTPGRASDAPPGSDTPVSIHFSETLAAEVRKEIESLPPYYRTLLPEADAARLRALLEAGRGNSDDVVFLREHLLAGFCRRSKSEYAGILALREALERKVLDVAGSDVIHFKDGRRVEALIEEETDEHVRAKARFGSARFPRSEIARIERLPIAPAEFRKRYEEARGKAGALEALLAFCREKNLGPQKELAVYALLALDPGHDAARKELGLAGKTPATPPPAGSGKAEADTIRLKDGSVRTGLIAAETEAALTLELFVRGPRGETVGSGRLAIPRPDIASIERMSDDARARARERSISFEERSTRFTQALAAVQVVHDSILERPAFRAQGTHFELLTTGDEDFARELAVYLEEIFGAYRRYFTTLRNSGRKITIRVFAEPEEYSRYQQATLGGTFLNEAYYFSRDNSIAAQTLVQKTEAARIAAEIRRVRREIDAYKKHLAAEEDRVERLVRDLQAETLAAATQAQKSLVPGDAAEARRWKEERLTLLRRAERQVLDALAATRRQANQAIEKNSKVLLENSRILAAQTRRMYETLFHEAFHAFAANFLWDGRGERETPRWLNEGMATYFEMSAVETGGLIHGAPHPALLAILRKPAAGNPSMPLAELLRAGGDAYRVDHLGDAARSSAAYAHSWALVHYLVQTLPREKIEAYATDTRAGQDPVTALEKATGRRIADLETDVRRHVAGLK